MRFICNQCGEVFDEPEEIMERTGVHADCGAFGSMPEVVTYGACPNCGSPSFDRYIECMCCHDAPVMPRRDYCEDCFKDMESEIAIAFERFKRRHSDVSEDDMWYLLYDVWNVYDNEIMGKE
jgi:hypothetical protein